MTTAKWSAPGTASSNLNSSAQIDSLANGSTSAFLATYANGTNLDLYAGLLINLTSITPTTGGSITVRVFASVNGSAPDNTASVGVGGGDAYTIPLTTSASAKQVTIPMIRLYPGNIFIAITNNSGVALGTGNTVVLQPYDESAA